MDPLALVCAVGREASPVLGRLDEIRPVPLGRRKAWQGSIAARPVILVECGMGKTNAAHALTLLLERFSVRAVIGFGVAGAYSGTLLDVGDVALADRQIYGDEGVETPDGWISCEGIGIPLVETAERPLYNHFPVDPRLLTAAVAALRTGARTVPVGPFVTVSCCSGRSERGAELALRHNAICETMEGAAYAHIAAVYGVPFLEVRGISNPVEDRDLGQWDIGQGAAAAAKAVATVVQAF
jgi:futalosine hydrolase